MDPQDAHQLILEIFDSLDEYRDKIGWILEEKISELAATPSWELTDEDIENIERIARYLNELGGVK